MAGAAEDGASSAFAMTGARSAAAAATANLFIAEPLSRGRLQFSCGLALRLHQGPDMRRRGVGQRIEVVAALKGGDQAALGMLRGDRQQLLADPGEILGLELELGERIAAMGVEARRHD